MAFKMKGLSPLKQQYKTIDNPINSGDEEYQAWRSKLPANLREETEHYNLRGAFEGGLKPILMEDGTYHLSSVNPKTGEILKSMSHPTAWMELRENLLSTDDYHKNHHIVVNPEGYFGNKTLQYVKGSTGTIEKLGKIGSFDVQDKTKTLFDDR